MNEYMDEYMNEYIDGYMNEYRNEYRAPGVRCQVARKLYRLVPFTCKLESCAVYVQLGILHRLCATPAAQPRPAPCVFRSRY